MPSLIRTIGAAAALALIAGCGAGRQAAAPTATSADAGVTLGDSLSGESCRAVRRPPARGERPGRAAYDVFCGAGKRPSGAIIATPANNGVARAAVERAMRDDLAAQERSTRIDCVAPKWVGDGAQEYAIASCAL